jgi:hypothetical protein
MSNEEGGYILAMGRARAVLLGVGLALCAFVFLAMAVFAAIIPLDNLAVRFALLLGAIVLVALAGYFLLLTRVIIIRIEVGSTHVKITTPRLRGPLPLLSTIRAELPYDEIAAVEVREEIYSSFGLAVTAQRAFSLVTRDGARLPLGVMAENWGGQLPFDEAAQRIARRAGLPLVNRGVVYVGGVTRAMISGPPPWSADSMTPAQAGAWRNRALFTAQLVLFLTGATALLRSCGKS